MEQTYCTAVFWRGGEKIELNGLEPDAVRCLSVTGERKVNLSFLRDYPNLEELTLMEKCEGVEVLSGLKQLHTLSLWLSAPVSWDNVSLPGLRVLHLRGEKNGDITPLLTSITYLHLEEMRKTEDLAAFLTPATRLQKLYLQSLPAVQELPALDGLPSLYALKLYELHKLNDLSALSHSHLRYFAASLIGDKLSAQALADGRRVIRRFGAQADLAEAVLDLADHDADPHALNAAGKAGDRVQIVLRGGEFRKQTLGHDAHADRSVCVKLHRLRQLCLHPEAGKALGIEKELVDGIHVRARLDQRSGRAVGIGRGVGKLETARVRRDRHIQALRDPFCNGHAKLQQDRVDDLAAGGLVRLDELRAGKGIAAVMVDRADGREAHAHRIEGQ